MNKEVKIILSIFIAVVFIIVAVAVNQHGDKIRALEVVFVDLDERVVEIEGKNWMQDEALNVHGMIIGDVDEEVVVEEEVVVDPQPVVVESESEWDPAEQVVEVEIEEQHKFLNKYEERVNQIREEHGLPALVASTCLRERAEIRLNDIQYKFSHERPDGLPYYTARVCKEGGSQKVGENILKDLMQGDNQEDVIVLGWMNSPSHRQVVLSEKYTRIGIFVKWDMAVMEVSN